MPGPFKTQEALDAPRIQEVPQARFRTEVEWTPLENISTPHEFQFKQFKQV